MTVNINDTAQKDRSPVLRGMGGAMDLLGGVKRVVVMDRTNKAGGSKVLKACTLPLTGKGVVGRIITNLGVLDAVRSPTRRRSAAVARDMLERAGVEASEIDEVILGQVLPAGEGQNPARQAAMKAGIPQEATACGVNQLCGSVRRAVALGIQQIATGDANIIVESMFMALHCAHPRNGTKMGDMKMIDTMIKDGLTVAFHRYHMGIAAENVARQYQRSVRSRTLRLAWQKTAEAAQRAGRFRRRDLSGSIAIGHPIGASGARVLNTLLLEMKRRSAKKGLATLCIGGGMGIALCVEAM